ncbi:MAG TPA: geranylgeranyl reductase family protein [Nitrospiraceae bacterium]|nr:geranylgeranyl reductase family protein [Nitrospiraceae bacterium]
MHTISDKERYDAIVVGTGPAGATAAYELSRAGLSVLAIEKYTHPRYKVCGGGLSVRIEQLLDPAFKSVVEHTIFGIQFSYRGQDSVMIESPNPIAYMVMRDRFDHHLVQQARRVGTDIHEGESARSFHHVEDGVEVTTDRGRYHAQVLIGADGANSQVARNLFPGRRLRCIPTLESEIEIGQGPQYPLQGKALIDIGAGSMGYAWIFPKQGRLSVGVGEFQSKPASLKNTFDRFVRGDKGLASLDVPKPVGHPLPLFSSRTEPYRQQEPGEFVNGRALLVGDAGHLVDPLFGEGIYYAVRSGQMAATAVLDQLHDRNRSLWDYELTIRQELYPEFRVCSRLADIVYTFPRLCYRLLTPYQEVIQLYYEVLQGKETYQSFYRRAKEAVKCSSRELLLKAMQLR